MVRVKKNTKFISKNQDGEDNGYVIPIVDIKDEFPALGRFPHQVYLTVVAPGEIKGPHHHKIRYAMYTCIKGNIKVVVKNQDSYEVYYSGEDHDYATIWVEEGLPTALVNLENVRESMIINTPNPSFRECPEDDYFVEFDPNYLNSEIH